MNGPSPPPVTDAYQQSQPQNMNSPSSHFFVSVPIPSGGEQYRSQSDMDPSEKTPNSNGMRSPPLRHLSSPRARYISPPSSQRRTTPWAQVVMGPDTPPPTEGSPQQFSRGLLRPQHQDSPRVSLEDLIATEPLPPDDHVQPQDDSDEGEEDLDTLSISSSIYRGQVEHGRRYARDTDYIAPSDEKQFESMQAGHLMYTILESQRRNPFFRSPIPEEGHHHIMDVGTGDGAWAVDVADTFENYTIHAVDLYPPPQDWVPPNVLFEVDDLSKPWIDYGHKFSLIHIRLLLGAFSSVGWDRLYAEAYEHLEPGGWIEHLECDIDIRCEDGSLPPNSQLITFGRVANDCANEMGCPLTIYHEMRSRIERAGFVNIQEKVFKAPIGGWPRNTTYKDAGKCSLKHFKTGMSGWLLRLLTKYGNPDPWEPNKAQIWLAVLKRELDAGHHIYQNQRRIWAQKPY